MSTKTSYSTIRTFISDYKTGAKSEADIMHGMLVEDTNKNVSSVELLTYKGIVNVTIRREGDDFLDFKVLLNDDKNMVLSQGRSLNKDFKETVANRSLPENGIIVDAVQVELESGETMAIKTLREEKELKVVAVIREMHIPITEDDYLRLKDEFFSSKSEL